MLGVSTPTLKRMVAEGRLESFRTPGGHVRILAESIGAMRERRTERIRPVRDASPVLQNRRERLEELTLEAQEVRARRELEKLQREDEEEAEQQEEEEEAREQEAAERQAELELEREQLEQEQAQERARKEAERALAAFRYRWLQEANQALADPQCRWLSAAQKKEIIDAVEAEIGKRQPSDAPRMATILAHTIAALMERYQAERQAQKRRQEIIDRALWSVSVFATDQEKARAIVAVREAVRRLDADASESELLTSAQEAIRPINQVIERRRLKERVLNWAIQQLPWGKTELDAVRVRRECGEILAELPEDFSEAEAKEALVHDGLWRIDDAVGVRFLGRESLEETLINSIEKSLLLGVVVFVVGSAFKALRWASDRVGEKGIVAFISNNSYIEKNVFDGMRHHLLRDFDLLYVVDLHGDIRKDSMKDGIPLGEKNTIFGLSAMVGIALIFLVRTGSKTSALNFADVDFRATRQEKLSWLTRHSTIADLPIRRLTPDSRNQWLTDGVSTVFESFLPVANDNRTGISQDAIFAERSLGLNSNRDTWAYNFSREQLETNVTTLSAFYNAELRRWHGTPTNARGALDGFLRTEEDKIKWSSRLKEHLLAANEATFQAPHIRLAVYRPFSKQYLYFDRILNHRRGRLPRFFPSENTSNIALSVTDMSGRSDFSILASAVVPDLHLCASMDGFQCFPFYIFDEDGSNRRENVTDWALEEFRKHYNDATISKWDIFYYTYAVLHSPEYRERYAANLKRELPRIPYAPDFWGFAKAGKCLAELHVNYEKQPEYPLERNENPNAKLSFRVEKMRLGKDKSALVYNEFLTLAGIPPETFEYRLGNRSALEWVIDQYQVSTDKRSGITNDPNREDDPEYIVRLIGQVITVSKETVRIVKALPDLGIAANAASV